MTARIRSVGPEVDLIVGENVRKLRDVRGWSRGDLHDNMFLAYGKALSVATIGTIEDPNLERRVTAGELVLLAGTLGVPMDVLTKEIK